MCLDPEWFESEAQATRRAAYATMTNGEAESALEMLQTTAYPVGEEVAAYIRENWSRVRIATLSHLAQELIAHGRDAFKAPWGDSVSSGATSSPTPAQSPSSWISPDLRDLARELARFEADRNWQQFHSPKNLAMALVKETAELMEPFQWLTPEASDQIDPEKRQQVAEEIGDVLNYLVQLADRLGIDPLGAAANKISKNAEKYPVHKARDSAKKYDEL